MSPELQAAAHSQRGHAVTGAPSVTGTSRGFTSGTELRQAQTPLRTVLLRALERLGRRKRAAQPSAGAVSKQPGEAYIEALQRYQMRRRQQFVGEIWQHGSKMAREVLREALPHELGTPHGRDIIQAAVRRALEEGNTEGTGESLAATASRLMSTRSPRFSPAAPSTLVEMRRTTSAAAARARVNQAFPAASSSAEAREQMRALRELAASPQPSALR